MRLKIYGLVEEKDVSLDELKEIFDMYSKTHSLVLTASEARLVPKAINECGGPHDILKLMRDDIKAAKDKVDMLYEAIDKALDLIEQITVLLEDYQEW